MQWKHVKAPAALSAFVTGVKRSAVDARDFLAHDIFDLQHAHYKKEAEKEAAKQKDAVENSNETNESKLHHLVSKPAEYLHKLAQLFPHIGRLQHSKDALADTETKEAKNVIADTETKDAAADVIAGAHHHATEPYVIDELPSSWNCFDAHGTTTIALNDVYDQGATNECVAYSFCILAEFQIYHRSPELYKNGIRFSPKRLYSLRRNCLEEGMSGRDCVELSCRKGFVEFHTYEKHQDIDRELNRLAKECEKTKDSIKNAQLVKGYSGNSMREQYNKKLRTLETELLNKQKELDDIVFTIQDQDAGASENKHCYAKVSTVDSLKKSIYFNGPCPSILPFYPVAQGDKFWIPADGHQKNGDLGHCISFIGWDDTKRSFLIRNSWGKKYNANAKYPGHAFLPFEHIEQNIPWEIWTIFYNGKDHLRFVQEKLAGSCMGGVKVQETVNQPQNLVIESEVVVEQLKSEEEPKYNQQEIQEQKYKQQEMEEVKQSEIQLEEQKVPELQLQESVELIPQNQSLLENVGSYQNQVEQQAQNVPDSVLNNVFEPRDDNNTKFYDESVSSITRPNTFSQKYNLHNLIAQRQSNNSIVQTHVYMAQSKSEISNSESNKSEKKEQVAGKSANQSSWFDFSNFCPSFCYK